MRIGVLYRTTNGPWGGGNSFLRSLKKAWRDMGVEVTGSLGADLDAVLINSSYLGATGRRRNLTPALARRTVETGYLSPLLPALGVSRWRAGRRPPFVHRLDGVFRLYRQRSAEPDDLAQIEINRWMDWTIYQSHYCRESFATEGLDVTRSSVIWNGVDTGVFFPCSYTGRVTPLKLVAAAWSPNIDKGAPCALRASRMRDVQVTFIGHWPEGLERGNVAIVPPCSHEELSWRLRQHDGFLHMAQNDSCSNAILEAMASGLPVIYHPSGGSPEIVGTCGISGEPDFEGAVREFQERHDDLRARLLERIPTLSIHHAARKYLDVFQELTHSVP